MRALIWLMLGCTSGLDDIKGDSDPLKADEDGDGFTASDGDCDDANENVFPDAPEICNSVDDDCDGDIDEDIQTIFWEDADNDGFGNPDVMIESCEAPANYVPNSNDCNDRNEDIYPGNSETCDGIDNDCDQEIDEDVQPTWYADADADGYGDPSTTTQSCDQPSGFVADATDCDDTNNGVSPSALERCNQIDDDCDGSIDEDDAFDALTWYADADADGYGDATTTTQACDLPAGYTDNSEDCDDADSATFPGAIELCDGDDDDCDGSIDEDAANAAIWYADSDGDGYGDPSVTAADCAAPAGYVGDATDCDDRNSLISPAGLELCNTVDDDCDGVVDEGAIDALTWYLDSDGDSYGGTSATVASCDQPAGFVANTDDCDDSSALISPASAERCNGADDDCDGDIDEDGIDAPTWYIDIDGDGFGASSTYDTAACDAPVGYTADATDCDNLDATIYPGATETCDSQDEDCDGSIDEGATDPVIWYRDTDGDGYGDPTNTVLDCSAPAGTVGDATDCDDGDGSVHPGAAERCDGMDQDCDGTVDEDAVDPDIWFADSDSDGYGDPSVTAEGCTAPAGYLADSSDCDGADPSVHPGATETCDSQDEDCDGQIDEGATDPATWYRDTDGDGYGDPTNTVLDCSAPAGTVSDATDCDDSDGGVHPGATEHCDGVDEDCDGTVDEGGVDPDTWFYDGDGDGYGDASVTAEGCTAPAGYVADDNDCAPADPETYPGAVDICDGVDNDCDGDPNEGGLPGWGLVQLQTDLSEIRVIDTATGSTTLLSEPDTSGLGTININSFSYDTQAGVTWVHDQQSGSSRRLLSLDLCTGDVEVVGTTGIGNVCGLTVGTDGALWGLDATSDTLVRFDSGTATATTIGSLGFSLFDCGMAYDCSNDRLYGLNVNSSSHRATIFTVDVSTGAGTTLVELDNSVSWNGAGLAFDSETGTLYVVHIGDTYSVDLTTGDVTYVSSEGGNNLDWAPVDCE